MKKNFIIATSLATIMLGTAGIGLISNKNVLIEDILIGKQESLESKTPPIFAELTYVITEAKTISLTTTWTEYATDPIVGITYILTEEKGYNNIEKHEVHSSPTSRPGIMTNTATYSGVSLDEGNSFEAEAILSFSDSPDIVLDTWLHTSPGHEEVKLKDILITNHSIGHIGITVNYENKNLWPYDGRSYISIFKSDTDTLIEEIPLDKESSHTYINTKVLKPGTEYYVRTSMYSSGNMTKDFTTLSADDTNITNSSLELTPTTFGLEDGSIGIDMTIDQKAANDITDISITLDGQEQVLSSPPNFSEIGPVRMKHIIPDLALGTYVVKVELTSDSAVTPIIQSQKVTVQADQTTLPTSTATIEYPPRENEDGSVTYEKYETKVTIDLPTTSPMDIGDVDATNAMFEIKPTRITGSSSDPKIINTYWDYSNSTFSLSEDLVIPESDVISGYTIELVDAFFTPLPNYEIIFPVVTVPGLEEGMSGGVIAGIVVGSIVGVALLGTGTYLAFINKDKLTSKKDKDKSVSKKTTKKIKTK